MSVALATMLAATCAAGSAHTPEFNIKAFGAQEGGNVVCTQAITAAVAAARAAVVEGSAHEADVVVPAGKVRRSSHLVFHRCERDQLEVRRGVRCARGSTLNDAITFCVRVPHLPTFQTKLTRTHCTTTTGATQFLTGMFSLASGVFLRLDRDAILLGSTKSDDYPAAGWNWDPALVDTVSVNLRRALCGPPRHAHDKRWHGLDWLREHTSVFAFPAWPFVDELTWPLSSSHCICATLHSGPASVLLAKFFRHLPSALPY
jgi:hypothetical protein